MNCHEDESSGSSDDAVKVKKKHKKEKHKEKKQKKKKRKRRTSDSESENEKRSHRKHKKIKRKKNSKEKKDSSVADEAVPGPSVPTDLLTEHSKSRAPMTKEEWEKSQSVVRRVYDETGRSRLIKGDGEVLEEIVSKKRHREINQQATLGDGLYFENKAYKK